MSEIKRTELKKNFLKNIIMKIDLIGVLPNEVYGVVESVKNTLKQSGFERFQQKLGKDINFEITGLNGENEKLLEKTLKNETFDIYNFVDENRGISIEISNRFITISIKSTKYIKFSEYLNYLLVIYDKFKETIKFASIGRLGLRKINSCLITEKTKINELFNKKYFNITDISSENSNVFSNQKYLIINGDKKINFATNIQEGLRGVEKIYQIVLDNDIYIENLSSEIGSSELRDQVLNMNNIIFDIFIQALTVEFVEILKSDDECYLEYLIGVENNE